VPTSQTYFTLYNKTLIQAVTTYHWNNGSGKTPGTISICDPDGTVIDTFNANGRNGYLDAPNVYWDVFPNITLEPGLYLIVDSDSSTWSHNTQSNGEGFCKYKRYNSRIESIHKIKAISNDTLNILNLRLPFLFMFLKSNNF
jgi:hypothetical protein